MQRILLFVLLGLLPLNAAADGKVFSTALAADVTIPDQRALIYFSNGVERLVIETRFTGAGTNFAWVVPLPSQPIIEAATTGLFPTLQHIFQPQIIHEVVPIYLYVLGAAGGLIVFLALHQLKGFWPGVVLCLLLLGLAVFLLPALGTAKAGGDGSSNAAVTVLERNVIGVYETTTIAAREPNALVAWLQEHGFVIHSNALPVVADYVKDGWVFVATKLQRAVAEPGTSTSHPLSFTFRTDQPVYPMRLTGVDNGTLDVELYVFGGRRAEAKHFKVERCTRPNMPPQSRLRTFRDETLVIAHPQLSEWVSGAAVATKLTAKLAPEQMRQDVWIEWKPFSEQQSYRYSRRGAAILALNWSVGILATVLVGVGLVTGFGRSKVSLPKLIRGAAVFSLAAGGAIYIAAPTVEVRLVKMPRLHTKNAQANMVNLVYGEPLERAREIVGQLSNGVEFEAPGGMYRGGWTNFFLGGLIREEDSPGNFVLREADGKVFLVTFDGWGRESILGSWQPEPTK